LKIKQLESADLRAQQAHEARMLELKNQQTENQTKIASQTQAHIEERTPPNVLSTALGLGGGLFGGPLGAGFGWAVGKVVEKVLK